MKKLSLPVAAAGVAGVLALGVGGVAVISGHTAPAADQDVYVAPTEAPVATTSEAPAQVVEVPVAPPVAEVPAATVESVTTPAPQAPAAEPAPAVVDPESIGTTGSDGYYTPAPPRANPGEPPMDNIGGSAPLGGGDYTPLPGEPGYVGPAVGQPIPRD